MTNRTVTDTESALAELRRLVADRAAKKKELDSIDQAIEEALGIEKADRPQKPLLSGKDIRSLCRGRL